MRKLLASVVFLFAFGVAAQTEPPSSPIVVPAFDAGPASYMHPQLYSVPLSIGGIAGTMWLYPQSCNANGVCGFMILRAPLEGEVNMEALVTEWRANAYNSIGQVTSATLNYTVGDVLGSITFTFIYTYKTCGRYCTGWHETLSGAGAQFLP